jgi:diguanylate cyclase
MEVKDDVALGSASDLARRVESTQRQLRNAEIERVDLVQAMRLALRATAGLLRSRGFNNDLVDELRRLESRLGSETEPRGLLERHAELIRALAGKADSPLAWRLDEPGRVQNGASSSIEPGLNEALAGLVERLALFKNRRYQRVGEAVKSLLDIKASPEALLPVLTDLCLRFIEDYGEELDRISVRLSGIIRILLFTEREYARFLDDSIEDLQGDNKRFTDDLTARMGSIQSTVAEVAGSEEPESLLGLVIERIEQLCEVVQRKSQVDEDRLVALKREKIQLQDRLDTIRRDYDNFLRQSRSMFQELEAVKLISLRDQLTGIYNRRAYDEQTRLTLESYTTGALSAFSLVIFDIDFFREVNNVYGHLAGDRVLSNLAQVVSKTLRGDDFVFRYGGDEFVIILPEARLADAAKVAEKLRRQIEVVDFKLSRKGEAALRVTISLGVAEAGPGDTAATLLARADRALYQSKNGGRNRVTLAAR